MWRSAWVTSTGRLGWPPELRSVAALDLEQGVGGVEAVAAAAVVAAAAAAVVAAGVAVGPLVAGVSAHGTNRSI